MIGVIVSVSVIVLILIVTLTILVYQRTRAPKRPYNGYYSAESSSNLVTAYEGKPYWGPIAEPASKFQPSRGFHFDNNTYQSFPR